MNKALYATDRITEVPESYRRANPGCGSDLSITVREGKYGWPLVKEFYHEYRTEGRIFKYGHGSDNLTESKKMADAEFDKIKNFGKASAEIEA